MKGIGSTSNRAVALVVAAAVMAATIGTATAIAATPQSTMFTVVERFEPASGLFTSDGSVVCPGGTTSNEFSASGFQSDNAARDRGGVVLHDLKKITCNDGSGTFTLQLQGRTGFNVGFEGTFGRWVVLRGTGAYGDLHGQGAFSGEYTATGLDEVYVGRLALD